MSILFRRIQPAQRFHINLRYIAHFLKIPLSAIVRVERWAMFYLSIAVIKAVNSLVTVHLTVGLEQLLG